MFDDHASESCLSPAIVAAVAELSTVSDPNSRGAIFTRREVVEFILDLVGYTANCPLFESRMLEPSFGGGDFLLLIVQRLLDSWKNAGNPDSALVSLGDSIRAVELHVDSFDSTRTQISELLRRQGIASRTATALVNRWLCQDDYLLADLDGKFDFVVGNPPYLRQEMIPNTLLEEYRKRYSTMYDRADLYIPFIQRSLEMLNTGGLLGFICADRWMKNRYGGPLRAMVHKDYHLKMVVDMVDTDSFHSEVTAYPAITIISRNLSAPTRVAHRPNITGDALSKLSKSLRSNRSPKVGGVVREVAEVTNGTEPWLLDSCDELKLVRRLEGAFPTLEETGCRVGIGVATGADKAFISDFETMDVEPDRKLPIAMTGDITSGEVEWRGKGVINPFKEEGGLVDLEDFPKLNRYLNAHKDVIVKRHVAKKSPKNWYRTIDRITPSIAATAKLLIPDIKGEANVVYEDGKLYPHHNLYYVTASDWDLRALQAVLLSAVTRLFVATYSTKMRGGCFRFQAQYLRRIRLPNWSDVPKALRRKLKNSAKKVDVVACNAAVFELYGLSREEVAILSNNRSSMEPID